MPLPPHSTDRDCQPAGHFVLRSCIRAMPVSSLFLQQYTSLKMRFPERFNDPAEIDALKKKFAVTVKSIGMKK